MDSALAAAENVLEGAIFYHTRVLTHTRGGANCVPSPHTGEVRVGGQEHFYLEPHATLVVPSENDEFTVYTTTQVGCAFLELFFC